MTKNNTQPPAWMRPGQAVWYRPVLNGPRAFAGVVAEEPWQLGDGTWVTHLDDMDGAYQAVYHGRKRVIAACEASLMVRRDDDVRRTAILAVLNNWSGKENNGSVADRILSVLSVLEP